LTALYLSAATQRFGYTDDGEQASIERCICRTHGSFERQRLAQIGNCPFW